MTGIEGMTLGQRTVLAAHVALQYADIDFADVGGSGSGAGLAGKENAAAAPPRYSKPGLALKPHSAPFMDCSHPAINQPLYQIDPLASL